MWGFSRWIFFIHMLGVRTGSYGRCFKEIKKYSIDLFLIKHQIWNLFFYLEKSLNNKWNISYPSNNFAENPRKFPGIFPRNPRKFPGIFHGKIRWKCWQYSGEFFVTHSGEFPESNSREILQSDFGENPKFKKIPRNRFKIILRNSKIFNANNS